MRTEALLRLRVARTMRATIAASMALVLLACGDAPKSGNAAANPEQLALGEKLYAQHCAACHGANLEGQPEWRKRLDNGRMPAPPHDDSGHTWHHPDDVLFGITKFGLVPGKYAPPKYESDMPGFGELLSDEEIRAVLTFIESRWSPQIRAARDEMLRQRRQ